MRVLIIGAGVIGSMAAWQLASAGHEVTVLEQFHLDHDRGSSYGDSRIIRRVYADPFYTQLMAEGYALWDELQAQFPHKEICFRSGGVFFGPPDHPQIRAARQALSASGVPFESLDSAEARRRFPALLLHNNEIALYEPSMGYARASHAVQAASALATRAGAEIREGVQVLGVQPASARLAVRVWAEAKERDTEEFVADRLLICAGPWSGPLLAKLDIHLPLVVTRQPYIHLLPAQNPEDFEVGRFPVWIDAATYHYGMPRLGDLPGIKVALHDTKDATTPESVDRTVNDFDRKGLLQYAAERLPTLSDRVVFEKVCLYTMTPDEDFIVDSVPNFPGAYFIAGLSGHGFKFGPLLGKIAADLVTGTSVRYDLSRFRMARFF